MFTVTKHEEGPKGAFIKLVQLESEDFAVITRCSGDGRLHHKYIGPDLTEAEEVFQMEAGKIHAG
jgi:hypothetical protein